MQRPWEVPPHYLCALHMVTTVQRQLCCARVSKRLTSDCHLVLVCSRSWSWNIVWGLISLNVGVQIEFKGPAWGNHYLHQHFSSSGPAQTWNSCPSPAPICNYECPKILGEKDRRWIVVCKQHLALDSQKCSLCLFYFCSHFPLNFSNIFFQKYSKAIIF